MKKKMTDEKEQFNMHGDCHHNHKPVFRTKSQNSKP